MTKLSAFEEYTLLGQIDEGGMGVVYQAVHRGVNRPCALKVMRKCLMTTVEERRRFLTEAEATARLDHPNIVRVARAADFDGQWFIEMELIEGGTLAERIREGPLPPQEAAQMGERLARAVEHAHDRGILHRDIKPANVLLMPDGQPKLADFGLARFLERDSDLTRTLGVLGTPAYLAPELAGGNTRGATVRADIFSLGVVLFECLTGQRPFHGQTPLEILRAVQESPPPRPTTLAPGIAADLETICLKCLRKNPSERYATAGELADDLGRWMRREPISVRPPTPFETLIAKIRRNPVRAGLTALGLLAMVMVVTFIIASRATYYWLMVKIGDEHLITPPGEDGVYRLDLVDEPGPRCTYNFWKSPFGFYNNRKTPSGRFARLEFSGIPEEVASGLHVMVFSDVPGYADIPCSNTLSNASIFKLGIGERRERAYYFSEVNFATSNILARFPEASLRIVLLGAPEDSAPYQPAGPQKSQHRQ